MKIRVSDKYLSAAVFQSYRRIALSVLVEGEMGYRRWSKVEYSGGLLSHSKSNPLLFCKSQKRLITLGEV